MNEITRTAQQKLSLPEGLTARAPSLDDLPEVLELRNLCSRLVENRDEYTLEDLRSELTDPAFDLATEGILVEDGRGRVVAWGEIYDRAAHARIEMEAGAVHPSVRGRGVEDEIARWSERIARRHVALAAPEVEVTLVTGTHSEDEFGRGVCERAGMEVVRHFFAMEIDLDGELPEPIWPEGIELRELRPGLDERAFFFAKREAFADHWGHVPMEEAEAYERFRHWLETTPGYDPTLFRAAMDGEEVAGVCCTWPKCDARTDQGLVSHIAVRRPWRKRGIARAMLLDAFRECQRRGKNSVALGVDSQNTTGAVKLYEKAGMEIADRYDLYSKVLRAGAAERPKEEEAT